MAIRLLPYALAALIYGDVRDARRRASANQSGSSCLFALKLGGRGRRARACVRGAQLARLCRAAASTVRGPKNKPSRYLIGFVRLVQNKLLLIQLTENVKAGQNRIVGAFCPFILWLQSQSGR